MKRFTIRHDFDILDVLTILVKSWYIIIGLPAAVALIAWLWVINSPPRFQAVATTQMVLDAPVLVRSTRFQRGLAETEAGKLAAATIGQVVAENDPQTYHTRLVITDTDAKRVEQLAVAAVQLLQQLTPKDYMLEVQAAITVTSEQVKQLQSSVDLVQSAVKSSDTDSRVSPDEGARALQGLIAILKEKRTDLLSLQRKLAKLESLDTEVPIVEVTRLRQDNRSIVAAILGAGVLALLWAYLRYALEEARMVRRNPVTAFQFQEHSQNLTQSSGQEGYVEEAASGHGIDSIEDVDVEIETGPQLKVLYVDGVGPFGGASRSLFEAVRALPAGSVAPLFIAAEGTALNFYRKLTDQFVVTRGLTRFDNTRYSHYRGIRWVVVLREIFHIPFMIWSILEAKRRWGHVDVIHSNEITEIIPLLIARRVFGAPAVVHVRSMQLGDSKTLRSRWLRTQLRKRVNAIIAIDENVRSTLPADVSVDVIHNSFTPVKSDSPDVEFLAKLDRLSPKSLKIGFIGNLHHGKGLMDLLEAAKLVTDHGCDVEFVIIGGETRADEGLKAATLRMMGLAQNVQERLEQRIEELKLRDCFHLFGSTTDIQRVYERIDVLCFPSHFDAAGRPVFEAAYSGVPSIASISDPRPDTLHHGETGLAIPAKNPQKLAEAIIFFAENRDEVSRMGRNARQLALRNFDPATNSRQLLAVYRKLARQSGNKPTDP